MASGRKFQVTLEIKIVAIQNSYQIQTDGIALLENGTSASKIKISMSKMPRIIKDKMRKISAYEKSRISRYCKQNRNK